MSKQYIRHNYIRDDISIDFPIPARLDEVIHEAEAYDTEKNIEFFCIADLIDNMCKGYYAQGKTQTWMGNSTGQRHCCYKGC